jgi:UTP--glucose-1-phosphate uridylyltransferase
VKTTDDLLVLRSDVFGIGKDFVLDQDGHGIPYVALDPEFFKFVSAFEKRFPEGAPSLREATSFTVEGDWTFGHGVTVAGEVSLDRPKTAQRVAAGTALGADA